VLETLLHDVPVPRQIFYLNRGQDPIQQALLALTSG
jgi:hypothetical protein